MNFRFEIAASNWAEFDEAVKAFREQRGSLQGGWQGANGAIARWSWLEPKDGDGFTSTSDLAAIMGVSALTVRLTNQ